MRRVYEEPSAQDGARVLVDRVWPRGLRKDALQLDDWAKDVAPSTELRTWYGHDPAKFGEFRQRYLGELAGASQRAALGRLRALAASGRALTLLMVPVAGVEKLSFVRLFRRSRQEKPVLVSAGAEEEAALARVVNG